MESLRLEYRDVSELDDNPANWRKHPEAQVAALRDVLAEVGWAGALLYNERTKRLIDGHARKKVATGKVPVLVGSWTEEQERKILATLDPLAAMAEADAEALEKLLQGISTESKALQDMLDTLAHENPLPTTAGDGGDEFDPTPEETGPTRTSPGELWTIGGKHRLLVGDCTVPENVERLMAGAKPFIMVTDPPYGVEYDPGWREIRQSEGILAGQLAGQRRLSIGKISNDDRVDWGAAFALFAGPVAYVWHAARFAKEVQQALEECEYSIRSQIVWVKPNFVISRGHYHWQHEPCFYSVRSDETAKWGGARDQSTVWEVASLQPMGRSQDAGDAPTGHGTQKPLECMARPIRNHGSEGDIVYDPFLGSGTTLIAAHRLNRVCYGCELECRYADVILRRAEAEGLECVRGS